MKSYDGLNVHKDSIFLCILCENGEELSDVFGVSTREITRLRDILVSYSICEVCMESTSICWVPNLEYSEC